MVSRVNGIEPLFYAFEANPDAVKELMGKQGQVPGAWLSPEKRTAYSRRLSPRHRRKSRQEKV